MEGKSMNRRFLVIASLIIALGASAAIATVSAQNIPSSSPTPVMLEPGCPVTTPVPPPETPTRTDQSPSGAVKGETNAADQCPPSIFVAGSSYQFGYGSLPYDFRFTDTIVGSDFQPGEQVTITVQNVSVAPVTVTVDSYGSFTTTMSFTWMFCGPKATTQPPPIFKAVGNQGSTAEYAESAPPCPLLMVVPPKLVENPTPEPRATGIVTVVPIGTAAPMTVIAQPMPPAPAPVPSRRGSDPVQPIPTFTPLLETLNIEGFGFVPGEQVALHIVEPSAVVAPPAPHVVADELGRIQATVQAYLPPPCGSWGGLPLLVAIGDKGTSVVTRLFWPRPWPLVALDMPCPVFRQPGGPPNPGSAPGTTPTSTPPGITPTSTSQNPTVPTQQPSSDVLSIRLHPTTVHPGGIERAIIEADGAGSVRLVIRYPGHRIAHLSRQIGGSGHLVVRWRVPRTVHHGRARVHVTFEPEHISLLAEFTIR
jgi:hypothetical protein